MQDLVGARFGQLAVICFDRIKKYGTNYIYIWECICDCGRFHSVDSSALKKGMTKRCSACQGRVNLRHGHSTAGGPSRTYLAWANMRNRCRLDPNYAGRGIQVCERWRSFENFLADMGEVPADMSIDRIDVNGNYEPANCRWATKKQQQNNTRRNRTLECAGRRMTLAEWSEALGWPRHVLWGRIRNGWSDERAITTPWTGDECQ